MIHTKKYKNKKNSKKKINKNKTLKNKTLKNKTLKNKTLKNKFKKIKNKSLKKMKGGDNQLNNNFVNNEEKRIGVIDSIENKTNNMVSNVSKYLYDKGLRLLGAEPIKKSTEIDTNIDNVYNKTSEIINKSGATAIEGLNNILESELVNETVTTAAENTKEITEDLMKTFNSKFEDPEYKEELSKTLDNISDVAEISLKALDKPIDTAVDKINESAVKATSAIASGAVRVGTDVMAAIPGIGSIVEMGKIMNDTSKAASSVVEAGTEATEAVSDLVIQTNDNLTEELDTFNKNKQIGTQIADRTSQSINNFNGGG